MSPDLIRVEGPSLVLRLITPEDAAYVHSLRIDPTYNQHLPLVQGTADDQRRWIESYKAREAEGLEFYYIIERKNGVPCGVVRLYDLKDDSFTWGSWILDENKPTKAALESAVLSFGIGFKSLNLQTAHVNVRIGNKRAEAFYRRLGMTETHKSQADIFFIYSRQQYEADLNRYMMLFSGKDEM
tara:strand:- start:5103 stop:5654 length:552 start_codon:yes stop_codon:yes gene_type:complete